MKIKSHARDAAQKELDEQPLRLVTNPHREPNPTGYYVQKLCNETLRRYIERQLRAGVKLSD